MRITANPWWVVDTKIALLCRDLDVQHVATLVRDTHQPLRADALKATPTFGRADGSLAARRPPAAYSCT